MVTLALRSLFATSLSALALLLVGCNSSSTPAAAPAGEKPAETAKGAPTADANTVTIDGSNTVYPIAAALVETMGDKSGAKITVGQAGTGAGFKKFIEGEIDIANASRPIKKEEADKLAEKGIEYYEIPVAFDGLAIIVNAKNALESVTTAELKATWNKDSKLTKWKEVNPAWPDTAFKLYGPTSDHGTYEYFNEAINGDKKNIRGDYSQQAQHDALVTAVSRDEAAFGFAPYSYAKSNPAVKLLKVDGGKGAIAPTDATIKDGTYAPLSRPLLMYVSKKAYDSKPGVKAYVAAALDVASNQAAVTAAQYMTIPGELLAFGKTRLEAGKTGSFMIDAKPGAPLAEIVKSAK